MHSSINTKPGNRSVMKIFAKIFGSNVADTNPWSGQGFQLKTISANEIGSSVN